MCEPEELKVDRKAPERRCIVLRESKPKDELIRFVASPEGVLVPDLAGKLPGRGYWVSCRKPALEKAMRQRLFNKVAKGPISVPEELVEQTQSLLEARALQFIALANKAGDVIVGFEKVADAIRHKPVLALVHATDASQASMHKLPINDGQRFCNFPGEVLSSKLGRENVVHLAVLEGKAGESALKEIRRFTGFLQKASL